MNLASLDTLRNALLNDALKKDFYSNAIINVKLDYTMWQTVNLTPDTIIWKKKKIKWIFNQSCKKKKSK